VRINGGGTPSLATQNALTTFANALQSANIAPLMSIIMPFAPDSLIAALTPLWKANSGTDPWTNHNFVAGDLTVNGLKPDGSTKYLDSGAIPNVIWPYNSGLYAGMSVYTNTFVANGSDFGSLAGGNNFFIGNETPGPYFYDNVGRVSGAALTGFVGFYSASRTSASRVDLYCANSTLAFQNLASNTANIGQSGSPGTLSMFGVGGVNNGGVYGGNSDHRVSFIACHQGLTSAQTQALYNAVQALRQAFGGGYV
jgi:hypothetical protein